MKRFGLLLFVSCVGPVRDEEIAALGPEVSGVDEGPTHRAGQPCNTCHGERGSAEPELSVGGTVYAAWSSDQAAPGAVVTITDARNREHRMTANSAGNFFATKVEFDPMYPLRVKVAFGGATEEMSTLVRRDGNCGKCHRRDGDSTHTVRIYVPGKGPSQ